MVQKIRCVGTAWTVAWLAAALLATGALADERAVPRGQGSAVESEDDARKGHQLRHFVFTTAGEPDHAAGTHFVHIDEHGHHFVTGTPGAGGGFLGVRMTELTPELRRHFGAPETAGVMIAKVLADTPAARAGLAVGDIILEVDGQTVRSGRDLGRAVQGGEEGDVLSFLALRGGARITLAAELETREQPQPMVRRVLVRCDEQDEDCSYSYDHGHPDLEELEGIACEDPGPCVIKVRCASEGECRCTVNGEPADCGMMGLPSEASGPVENPGRGS